MDGLACCTCAENVQEVLCLLRVLPMCSHLCSKFIASLHTPLSLLPTRWIYRMNAEHVLYLKGPGNVEFALLKICSTCIPTSDWELWKKYGTLVRDFSDYRGALLIWDLLTVSENDHFIFQVFQ